MFEALSFLSPQGPVIHDEQSRIYYDSMLATGMCLGTIQARTHVQLALACQHSMIRAQHRLRLTMQHVFGHGVNLGSECADHAAAHNVVTRWVRHNFDTSQCFEGCNNISEILERLQHIRTHAAPSHQTGFSVGSSRRVQCVFCAPHVNYRHVFLLLSGFFCSLWSVVFQTSDGPTLFIRVCRTEY